MRACPDARLCAPPVLPAASARFLQDKVRASLIAVCLFVCLCFASLGFGGHLCSCPHSQRFRPWGQQASWGWPAHNGPRPGVLGPATRLPPFFPQRRSGQRRGICWATHRVESVWGRCAPTRAGIRVRWSEVPSATPPSSRNWGGKAGAERLRLSAGARAHVLSLQNKPHWAAARLARGARPSSVVPSLPLPGHCGLRCLTPGLPAAVHEGAGLEVPMVPWPGQP